MLRVVRQLLAVDDLRHAAHVGFARYAETWAGYIAMERSRRNVREARSLYKRCHSRRLQDGGQAAICMAWLRFEREEGRCAAHSDSRSTAIDSKHIWLITLTALRSNKRHDHILIY